jgi:FkbM family methyltransferase
MYKYLPNPLDFGPDQWMWPEGDDKLVCIFEHVADIDDWIGLVENTGSCVQAGGATGVFPLRLADFFNCVHSFEAQPENFRCLEENTGGRVKTYHNALGYERRKVSIHSSIGERRNYGAGYIVNDPQGVEVVRIDDLNLTDCGLILLDIEGAELEALKGAAETIERCRPLVIVEDKPLPHMGQFNRKQGDPGRWLERFGYSFIKRMRWDSIYQC